MSETFHIFGVRHHGPGSARSLLRALENLKPDFVLIEGPPDADDVVSYAASPEMKPPVALLVYVPDNPSRAVFYPFASFSPEWTAIQYGLREQVPIRFMDLPQSNQLALDEAVDPEQGPPQNAHGNPTVIDPLRADPLGFLARAAGYSDSERWWESLVEHRRTDLDVFSAILAAMSAVREELRGDIDPLDSAREAAMRQTMRKVRRDGYCRIAVVCGAWHAPVLSDLSSPKNDTDRLEGFPKIKTAATWVPWTHDRLSYNSGYGAGVESPGWYTHLWETEGNVAVSWMSKVSRLLRQHDLDSSPAQVIDAVRLAETIAVLRDRPLPGLLEMSESVQTVLSYGSPLRLKLIEQQLIIGENQGAVPTDTPMVPLQSDISRLQKSLRMPAEPVARLLDLDLRKEFDLTRSHLLHQLSLLKIPWGTCERTTGAKGTFHELWNLQWKPEFTVAVIESAVWGNGVKEASDNFACSLSRSLTDLGALSDLLDKVILANLPNAAAYLMRRLETESALASDVGQLMDSFSPLVAIGRYGNVRHTDADLITRVIDTLAVRIVLGLPAACLSLDDQAARAVYSRIKRVHTSFMILQDEDYKAAWLSALSSLATADTQNGLIAGESCRILLDCGAKEPGEVAQTLGLALSSANDPLKAADWIEGFLSGSGQLLMLDENLRAIVDEWVCSLTDENFVNLLPLVRRTFSTFTTPERKQIGECVRTKLTTGGIELGDDDSAFNYETADAALPLLLKLLGLSIRENHVDR